MEDTEFVAWPTDANGDVEEDPMCSQSLNCVNILMFPEALCGSQEKGRRTEHTSSLPSRNDLALSEHTRSAVYLAVIIMGRGGFVQSCRSTTRVNRLR